MFKEAVDRDKLRDLEREFVAKTFISPRSWKSVDGEIEFPQKKKGVVVVDVGAGTSEATAVLASQGATAIAVDPAYTSPLKEIVERSEAHIENLKTLPIVGEEPRIDLLRRALKRFADDFKTRRKRRGIYIPALAGDLPFEDESVDFVFSTSCIVFFLDRNWDLLWGAVQESLRVLKPGGQIQISPIGGEVFIVTGVPEIGREQRKRKRNQERLSKELDKQGIRNEVVAYPLPIGVPAGTLRIYK